jgi:hypothetical protein
MDLSLGDTPMIVDACLQEGLLRNQCAYVLATAYHESAHLMKPITELGGQKYLKGKPYYPFIGRGYVQITWEVNYKKASDKLGVDFVKNPALLLQAEYAAPILVLGMKEGWFTGDRKGRHTLARYINTSQSDFKGARRIINGTDKADLIAGYAQVYDDLLQKAGYGVTKPQAAPPAPVQPVAATQTPVTPPAAPAPSMREPQPLPPKPSKIAPAVTVVALIAMALAGFWHHVTELVSNLF